MLQLNRFTITLLVTTVIYLCQTTECWMPSLIKSNLRSFNHNTDYKLSKTYDDVIAIALQCISNGNSAQSETAYYADVYFTFKQVNDSTTGTFRHIYSSQNVSAGVWKAEDNKGIQLSSISLKSYWNSVRCDVVHITTNSKTVQDSITVPEYQSVIMKCPEDSDTLTISKAEYGSNERANCTADVTDIVSELCNNTTDSEICVFSVLNGQLHGDPCFGVKKEINIDYICTQLDCAMNDNDVDSNCSRVWMELLGKQMTSSVDHASISKIFPLKSYLTKYEKKLTQLETNQLCVESKLQSQNELLKDHENLIHEWIIPTLELIFAESDALKQKQQLVQHMERLSDRTEKSFKLYGKLE